MAAAGMHRNASTDIFFAAQFLVPLSGAVAGSLMGSNTLYCIVASGVVGYLIARPVVKPEDREPKRNGFAEAYRTHWI